MNQIMLFHATHKTLIPPANETDLGTYFRKVRNGEADLVDLLRNIMVRRTRRYVLGQYGRTDGDGRRYLEVGGERKYFPRRDMVTGRYDIGAAYRQKYGRIVGMLGKGHLTFARYSPGLYVRQDFEDVAIYRDLKKSGERLVGLIRHLLLKRMESSIEAFRDSIGRYIRTHGIFLRLLDEGIVPIGDVSVKEMFAMAEADPDSIYDPDTIEEFRRRTSGAGSAKYRIDAFDIERLRGDIQSDLETFEMIDGMIGKIPVRTDDTSSTGCKACWTGSMRAGRS